MYETLKELVDSWHELADNLEDYQSTTVEGDGIQLVLLVNRTKDGDLRLQVMAAKDKFDLPRQVLVNPFSDEPAIPSAEVTIGKSADSENGD